MIEQLRAASPKLVSASRLHISSVSPRRATAGPGTEMPGVVFKIVITQTLLKKEQFAECMCRENGQIEPQLPLTLQQTILLYERSIKC